MAMTIVLVTGANRGIGKGLLQQYLSKPNHTVVAAVRDPSHATSKGLADLQKGVGSSLVVVKLDVTVQTDAGEAVKQLEAQGIDHLDVVIANAGVCYAWPKVSELTVKEIEGHYVPNVYGLIWTYQATLPLLNKSKSGKWITIGSCSAWLESCIIPRLLAPPAIILRVNVVLRNQLDMPNAAYATSKVVAHWLTKAIHREEPTLIAFPVDPGWVQTDLGNNGAHHFGYDTAPLKTEEVTEGIVKVVDEATRDNYSGKLVQWDGKVLPW